MSKLSVAVTTICPFPEPLVGDIVHQEFELNEAVHLPLQLTSITAVPFILGIES